MTYGFNPFLNMNLGTVPLTGMSFGGTQNLNMGGGGFSMPAANTNFFTNSFNPMAVTQGAPAGGNNYLQNVVSSVTGNPGFSTLPAAPALNVNWTGFPTSFANTTVPVDSAPSTNFNLAQSPANAYMGLDFSNLVGPIPKMPTNAELMADPFKYVPNDTKAQLAFIQSSMSSVLTGLKEQVAQIMADPANYGVSGANGGGAVGGNPAPVGGGAQAAIKWAEGELGVTEANNPSRVASYGGGNAQTPWCAFFVSTAFGGKNAPWGLEGWVLNIKKWGEKNGRFGKTPQVGSVIILEWKGGGQHTGIVTKVENGRVYTIEGNASNSVKRNSYSLSDSQITGFVYPP